MNSHDLTPVYPTGTRRHDIEGSPVGDVDA